MNLELFPSFKQKTGFPIYAWKGESEEDFWWCIEQCISNQGWTPNLVRPLVDFSSFFFLTFVFHIPQIKH